MRRPHIVIVGAGFAGFQAARTLSRLAAGRADITIINPNDYFLYLPLLPEVATGVLEPRRVTVSLAATLPGIRMLLGQANNIDLGRREVVYEDRDGRSRTVRYDRLIISVGSVNKLLPIPGVAVHAHGFRGLPECLFLRDHIVGQIERASVSDRAQKEALRNFVVVGAGYTGTEVAAHGALFTKALARHHPDVRPRWTLLDIADRVLPEMDERMSQTADRVLRKRGVNVLMGTSVQEAMHDGVRLSNGQHIPTRSLIWCVGVRPDPLAAELGLPIREGRLVVDEYLNVPGHPEVFACGDAAAVPDPDRPGKITAMTAQHAVRQGAVAARNIAASYGTGRRRPYRRRGLGFVVDLGGRDAAANPLNVPLSGLPAKAVTSGYHLLALPGNRLRVSADWLLESLVRRQPVQLGLVAPQAVPLDSTAPEVPASWATG